MIRVDRSPSSTVAVCLGCDWREVVLAHATPGLLAQVAPAHVYACAAIPDARRAAEVAELRRKALEERDRRKSSTPARP